MKKLLLPMFLVFGLFMSSEASYRVSVILDENGIYRANDTNSVSLKQRISMCVRINCAKIQTGIITKTQLMRDTAFTADQMDSVCRYAISGGLIDSFLPILS